jgi:dienelactone hydrolase
METNTRLDLRLFAIGLMTFAMPAPPSAQSADALPRRAALGVALAVDDAGAVVFGTVPAGSAAAAAGALPGDVIAALDGVPITTTAQVQALVGAHRGGEALAIDVERNGEPKRLRATLQPFGVDRLANATFTYAHVALDDGTRLRTIVSTPTDTALPAPAVLLLQGGGCGSIDVPMAGSAGPNSLVHAIAAAGFVTMRVDKPGTGDSEGPPCAETGYLEELGGYRAALRALLANPAVDAEQIFLVGMSLGGFFAPIVARDAPIAGIAVYGTIAFEPTPYPGRSERFFREIADADILEAWRNTESRVLALHGSYDETTTAADHAKIAAIVNAAHAGLAEHRELDGLDHGGTRYATLEGSRGNVGGGESVGDVNDAVIAFLRATVQSAAREGPTRNAR